MISVVVYGRNDTHGYNAHRRVALSLNCIAEVLTDPADEILFADYNTAESLPTLPEALDDTLTDRCRERIRVLRVRAATHDAAYGGGTTLPVVEPLARNIAVRRSNPSNRWVLLTNTDMVLVPHGPRSLSQICAALPDGFYTIPRFELPEWVWEKLPRADPTRAMREIGDLGPRLRLNETTTSHDWLRFDCAGDFQLALRGDLFDIGGLDERMTLGWHVDANLGQRMLLHRGSIESLAYEVDGYHCNHARTTTNLQRQDAMNDFGRFVVGLNDVDVPMQRDVWGLPDTEIEEIDLKPEAASELVAAVTGAIAETAMPLESTDARNEKWRLEYDSGHVMAFVADVLRVARAGSRVAYLGTNATLAEMLRVVVGSLGWPELSVLDSDPLGSDAGNADLFVVDLGVDARLADEPLSTAAGASAARLRSDLRATFETFRRLVELERDAVTRGSHARPFALINSSAVYWNAFTIAHLSCGPTTPHSVVRRATVKADPDDGADAQAAERRALQLWRWISRRDEAARPLLLRPGRRLDLAAVDEYSGFAEGWSFPDREGIPTAGSIAGVELSVADRSSELDLELLFDRFPEGNAAAPIATARGTPLESVVTHTRGGLLAWRLRVPCEHVVDGGIRLKLQLSESGWRLRSIALMHSTALGGVRQLVRSLVQSSSGRTTPRH